MFILSIPFKVRSKVKVATTPGSDGCVTPLTDLVNGFYVPSAFFVLILGPTRGLLSQGA